MLLRVVVQHNFHLRRRTLAFEAFPFSTNRVLVGFVLCRGPSLTPFRFVRWIDSLQTRGAGGFRVSFASKVPKNSYDARAAITRTCCVNTSPVAGVFRDESSSVQ